MVGYSGRVVPAGFAQRYTHTGSAGAAQTLKCAWALVLVRLPRRQYLWLEHIPPHSPRPRGYPILTFWILLARFHLVCSVEQK